MKSRASAQAGSWKKAPEELRGEEARECGFPLNCALHSGSLKQVPAPDCAFLSPLGILATHRGLSGRRPGLAFPRLSASAPASGSSSPPSNGLRPRPASAARVTSAWGRDFLLRAPLGLGTESALWGLRGGGPGVPSRPDFGAGPSPLRRPVR